MNTTQRPWTTAAAGAVLLPLLMAILLSSCSLPFLEQGTYYVDSMYGSDGNDGLTEATAWRTIDKLNSFRFGEGSSFYFRRGGVYNGTLYPVSGTEPRNSVYGAFGEGAAPELRNCIDVSSGWSLHSAGIWVWNGTIGTDVGNIICEGGGESGGGIRCTRKCSSLDQLSEGSAEDLDLFYGKLQKKLYLKSETDPSGRFSAMYAALTDHIVNYVNSSRIVFEDLHLRYGGAHGFGGGGASYITIRRCEFDHIGGGFLPDGRQYGNGIEFWADASDNLVEQCLFHDIFDTAVTNQSHSSAAVQENIVYRNNVIYDCGMASVEVWNNDDRAVTRNIVFEHNTCVNAGQGWGSDRKETGGLGIHVVMFESAADMSEIYIRNNIFSDANAVYFIDESLWDSEPVIIDYNLVYQHQPSGTDDWEYDFFAVRWNPSVGSSVEEMETYDTLEEFRGAMPGWSFHSASVSDPDSLGFASPDDHDYELTAGSAAIDFCTDSSVAADYSGKRRLVPDAGAFEY